jgi:uncharacterized protein DUF1833
MPRNLLFSFRHSLESNFSDEVNLIFLTISHPNLFEPIRVVSDNRDYIYGGNTFIGFPFDITLLSDDDSPPTAKLSIQNIDSKIGETVRGLTSALRLKIELLHSNDFNTEISPAVSIASPSITVPYTADGLFLINISVDAFKVTADIKGWDYLQRTWPGKRATQASFPGLFR